ncbi:cupin domain-containing protein [Rhizobium sp. LCM 4573]|uniref:cupin domain-containing protein n=1 Tax=Rhizobium sp. LCM 4573 TaxID=1848291 RepID=UPI0008DADAE0|nr:cupin domain-containing protein [Rhizobium sp. LCM 4573]OHV81054.1 cupin [Rhizobium sp. LCM 4573]
MSSMEPKEFVLAGVTMKLLLSGEQTDGQFCLLENTSGGNTSTPIHVHARDDETVYIIEGELTAVIDGETRRLTAGQSIFLKRGVPHRLMNTTGRPARYILIATPALFDKFLAEAGRELKQDETAGPPTPEEIDRLKNASPKFGITLLPGWPDRR